MTLYEVLCLQKAVTLLYFLFRFLAAAQFPVTNLSRCRIFKLFFIFQLFEGMKSYRTDDNRVVLFRPLENMKRMNRTAKRACLPVSCVNVYEYYFLIFFCFQAF